MAALIQFCSQHPLALSAGALVLLVLAALVALAVRRKMVKKNIAGKIDSQLAEDLLLRAQQPMRAAEIAVRQGQLQDAAELFEKAGSRKRAAELYAQIGMQTKAEELLADEDRVVREREAQKAALRKRLEQEPEEDVASLDRLRPTKPVAKVPDPGDAARPVPSPDPGPGATPRPPILSDLGPRSPVGKTADKVASDALALAPTQAAMPSPLAAFGAVTSQGSSIEEPRGALVTMGGDGCAEHTLHQFGALPPAGLPPLSDRPVVVEPVSSPQPEPPLLAAQLSLGEAKPALDELCFGESKLAEQSLSLDGPAHASESNDPIVEGLPERRPSATRTTPRTPIPVVSSTVGAYRMVRPTEPEVFTPPPSLRPAASDGGIPGPARKAALPSGEYGAAGHRTPTPTARPALSLSTKPRSETPGPRSNPKGTALGVVPTRSGK